MIMWKEVIDYEGLYEVNSNGEIRNSLTERKLSPNYSNSSGYGQVNLRKDKIPRTFLIHRLVAQAFIENKKNLPEVNHIDEDKTNNHVSNLEWCTSKQNANHGTRVDRCNGIRKNNTTNMKSVIGISLLENTNITFPSINEAARNGFDKYAIIKCCKNQKGFKSHKGYRWEYI